MTKDFKYWKKQHDSNELREFNDDEIGTLWLKVKSIVRKGILDEFTASEGIKLSKTKLKDQFVELFTILSGDVKSSHVKLNRYFRYKYSNELFSLDTDYLVNELYKVENFKWGADTQNDLGKYLVKKYVKDNNSYDYLLSQIDNGIIRTVQDYLICSWYIHWSGILIENIFKEHSVVLPTLGKIKSVDFFINEIPFDLKVTSIPINFIHEERKKNNLKSELNVLKDAAKALRIKYKNDDANLYYVLTERLKDNGTQTAKEALNQIKEFRKNLVSMVKAHPLILAKNLYERQSDFRFGAENRIFLILVDNDSFEDSWKLKRNIDLLRPNIHSYLDKFATINKENLKLEFCKNGDSTNNPKKFEVLADIIIIEK